MTLDERIAAFESLGKGLVTIDPNTRAKLYDQVRNRNPWFVPGSIDAALTGVSYMLKEENLLAWVSCYDWPAKNAAKDIALVLAGNIPIVGFHDILCVLLSGHKAIIKLSSKDDLLIPFVCNKLVSVEPRFADVISYVETLSVFDAVIATGSDNTGRYFEYYFRNRPSIIRKNRTSAAVLTGSENDEQLDKLGLDVFTYFGLGCRNVSKLFVPSGYDFTRLLSRWLSFHEHTQHYKYANNYDYQKAIHLIGRSPFEDNGVILLTQNEKLVSPIAVLYYDTYASEHELSVRLSAVAEKLQCVVGGTHPANTSFGNTQTPRPSDYADGIDTINFLLHLN